MANKKILVVDDEQDWVDLLSMRLKSEGYDVEVALDGLQGMMQISKVNPDLVLLDIMMPAGGGLNVLKNVRMNEKTVKLPVIVITCKTDSKTKDQAEKLGVSGYFIKPVDMAMVMLKISEAFSTGQSKA
jgi:DNA-binding response OmpR family regulator